MLFKTVLRPEVLSLHVPNGGQRNKIVAAKLKAMGTLPGVPDFYVAWPAGTLWLELKASKGKLSDPQKDFANRALSIGHGFVECRSLEGVLQALREYGVPMRAKAEVAA